LCRGQQDSPKQAKGLDEGDDDEERAKPEPLLSTVNTVRTLISLYGHLAGSGEVDVEEFRSASAGLEVARAPAARCALSPVPRHAVDDYPRPPVAEG
jgi:hypothetical protein